VYFSAAHDTLKAFSIANGQLGAAPSSQASQVFDFPGAVPTISANGSSNGIVWLLESGFGGTLHAYDASNVANELYNSQMKSSRDSLGSYVRFTVPTVANGKVYVGTGNSVTVFGLIHQLPQPCLQTVMNAATLQAGAVAPGSIISIFGRNLGPNTTASLCAQFCSTLGGVSLFVNGVRTPLQYVSANQINAQVPFEVSAGQAIAELRSAGVAPAGIQFPIAPVAPGVFAKANGSLSLDEPATAGSVVTVYLTGQGPVQPAVSTGAAAPASPLAQAVYPVTATIGGLPAEVDAAALSPGSVGLFQVKLRVPQIDRGSYPLVVSVNGISSGSRLISVE
jgi:uncharacterized protein (TIGR03437 family)